MTRILMLAALCWSTVAGAQGYPAKPVRLVVPYAAGGPVDTVARVLGQQLTARWGQQVIVDNRVGSGGAVGAAAVVKSPPDGHTLLVTNSGPITAYPHLRKTVSFEFERDLAPVTLLSTSSIVLVVHPALPARTIPDLVRLARRQPGVMTTRRRVSAACSILRWCCSNRAPASGSSTCPTRAPPSRRSIC